jgi:hypothetical protein
LALFELRQQLLRAAIVARRHVAERLQTAGGIGRDRAQQLAELVRRTGIESALGAA